MPLHFDNLAEPSGLGLRISHEPGKPLCAVEVDGREVEVVSLGLDEAGGPGYMPTWLLLRVEPAVTVLLHACGDGSGWREADEGATDFSIRSGRSSRDYMTFTCGRCGSLHRMSGEGAIHWPEPFDDQVPRRRSQT